VNTLGSQEPGPTSAKLILGLTKATPTFTYVGTTTPVKVALTVVAGGSKRKAQNLFFRLGGRVGEKKKWTILSGIVVRCEWYFVDLNTLD
jgi:hypothetical protein